MVGDDKGRENLGDYGDFWGISFDFFAFVDFFVGGGGSSSEHSEHSDFLECGFWEHSEHSDFGGDGGDWGLVGAGVSQLL